MRLFFGSGRTWPWDLLCGNIGFYLLTYLKIAQGFEFEEVVILLATLEKHEALLFC